MSDKLYAGMDIGGTKLYAVICDSKGNIIGSERKKTKPEKGFDGVMSRVEEVIQEACVNANVDIKKIHAIGVGAPSPILPNGVAVSAPNMGWSNVPLVKSLEKRLGKPVFAENDCNAGVYGEYVLGAGKGAKSLVGFFMGTGLGGGIVINGNIITGVNHMAAELGHMVVTVNGRPCGCGKKGCLEAYASKVGMGQRFKELIIKEKKKSCITKECEGDYTNIRSKILREAYEANDKIVVDVLNESAEYLGIGIGNIITLLGPDRIVLGGGVLEELGGYLLERIKNTAKQHTHPQISFNDTEILLAKLGDNAVALGAVMYALRCIHVK